MKRQNVIDWDTYFMALAHLSGLRSKDPNTAVGAVIVDPAKRIVSIGYNGMPRGCSDDVYPWEREGSFLDTKYAYVVHAELNAILNAPRAVSGCSIYVSLFPCNECAKAIIQAGLTEVVYESDKYDGTDGNVASKRMLKDAGVKLRQLDKTVEVALKVTEESENGR
jgi:dCMP deaminase